MRRVYLTTKEVRQIREWRSAGYSVNEIIAWSNRSRKAVLKYVRDIPSKNTTPTKIDKDVLFQLLSQGVSALALAKAFDCHVSRIYQLTKMRERDIEREQEARVEAQNGGGVATQ